MDFKDKVIIVRTELYISQQNLAKEMGVSFATVNRLEKGHNKPSFITKARFDALRKKNGICFDDEIENRQ